MSRRRTALIIALASSLSAGVAGAALNQGQRPQRLAHPDLRALIATDRPEGLWRAMVVVEWDRPSLVIERFRRDQRARRGGLPAFQRHIVAFERDGITLGFEREAASIERLAWGRRALTFELTPEGDDERLTCRVPLRGPRAFIARCDGPLRPQRPHTRPRPARINWAGSPAVIRACGEAFYGAANEAACLDLVGGFSYDPTAIIQSCDDHIYGDSNALECLRSARDARLDPTPVLDACDQAMYGDGHTLACLDTALKAPYPPATMIRACDQAMYGDANALSCIESASHAAVDASSMIKVCDEAMYGDGAALDCLRRGVSF